MTTVLDAATLRRTCRRTGRVLEGVGAGQLEAPTPCAEWTVREVMAHLVAAADFFADVAELGESPEGRPWPEYRADELATAFSRQAGRLVAAFEREGAMARPMRLPTGAATGRLAVQVATAEVFVHGFDVAAATGQGFGDDALAEALLCSDYVALCAEVRHDPTRPFAAEVLLARPAGATDRLVAFLGRDPGASGPTVSQATGSSGPPAP